MLKNRQLDLTEKSIYESLRSVQETFVILQHGGSMRLDVLGTVGGEQIGEFVWDPVLGREELSPFLFG